MKTIKPPSGPGEKPPGGGSRDSSTESLRIMENKFRAIVEASPDIIWEIDLQGNFTYISPQSAPRLGYTTEELIGKPVFSLLQPDAVASIEKAFISHFRDSSSFAVLEVPARHKDGHPLFVEIRSVAIMDRDGKTTGFRGIAHDITDRKKAEQALRLANVYNRSLIEASLDPLVTIGPDGRITDVNGATEAVTGYPRKQLIGTDFSEYFIDPGKAREGYQEVFRTGHVRDYPLELRHRDGHVTSVLYNASVYRDEAGQVVGIFAAARDITDRKKAGQALRESEERYSALFSRNYSVSLLIDPGNGRIVDANDAAARYYGYSRDRLLSMKISDINRLPEDKVVRDLNRATTAREKHFFSAHYLAGGEKRNVEIFSGPITVQGKPLFYSIIHDITDRKRAEQALLESEERFRQVAENAGVWIWEVDANGLYTYASPIVETILGYTPEELVGKKHFYDLFASDVRDDLKRAAFAAIERREAIRNLVNPNIHKNGSRVILETSGAPITDDRGRLLGYRGTDMDITGRQQTAQALKESEERYRTLIDQIPDYVIVHRNGVLLYVNPSAAAHLGYAREDLIGKLVIPFIAPEHQDAVKKMMMMRIGGKVVDPYEMTITAQDGTLRTVLVNGALIQYMGEPASLNVLTDITPVKAAEETIRKANEALEKRVAERTEALTQANVQMEGEITARKKAEREISQSLAEKELLLREIHHRVKNNLQIIISLLNLQSRHIHDHKVLNAIQDSQNRVRAMALVHERIYRSHSLATVNLKDYVSYLVNQLFGFYMIPHSRIRVTIAMEDYPVDIDMAIPIGLIMNELVSNSIKHAFPDGQDRRDLDRMHTTCSGYPAVCLPR